MKSSQMQKCRVSVILFVLLISFVAMAQERKNDLIVKRDSSKVLCRVLVVNDQTVQYKKAADPDGPLFNILKSDIARIVYGSGETEVFQMSASRPFDNSTSHGAVILYPEAPWRTRNFVDNLSIWRPEELKAASKFYKAKAKHSKIGSFIFLSLGAAASVTGIVLLSSRDRNDTYRSSDQADLGLAAIIAGAAAGGVSGLFSQVRTKSFRRNAELVDKELSRRGVSLNELRIYPSVSVFNRSASVSLALQF